MGRVGSDGEAELRLSSRNSTSNKGFKFPKKFMKGDCTTVCNFSVPRKLRSAMKKRSRESVSPPLPVCKKLTRVAGGVELLTKDGSTKYKLKMKQSLAHGCVADGTQGPVTKDEEEVAEALYALAGVFSNTVKTDKAGSAVQELGINSSNLTKAESLLTPIDDMAVGKVEEEVKAVSYGDEAPNHSSNPEHSAGESIILHWQNGTSQPDILVGKQTTIEVGSDIPEVNLPLTTFESDKQQTIQKTCDSVVSEDWSELSKTRSKLPNLNKSLASVKCPTTVLAPIAAACGQAEVQHTIKETRNNGSSLRPDLPSITSCDTQELGIPLQPHIANHPAWFESTSCSAQSPKLSSSVLAKKDAQVSIHSKNPWKRCIAHVYISRFIKVLQITERKNRSIMLSSELRTNEAPKQVARIPVANLNEGKNGMTGVVSSDSFRRAATEKYATEVRNAVHLHKRLIQDQQQAPYEVYNAQKQSLDCLSLLPGSGQLEISNGINRAGNGREISTQLPFPGLLSQNQPSIPFPVPQNCYSSPSFSSHPSVAMGQKFQVPPNVGSTSYGATLMDATLSSIRQLEEQQQKRASLLMTRYKSGVAPPVIPNKQTEGPDIPPVFQHVQTLFSPSLSSVEVLGARYAPVLQRQLLSATSLLPSSTVKEQYHHLPSVHEANVGGVRSDNVPLRIICNQYI
ncbi:uncharacterized protein [Coffea arabica]|uniref:Uncharacterized protein isoform X1 n=1 Tax=Coffea arabica TaxID=13443 RepID=A0A6P6UMJ7_COFAR